jgi:Zn finger protein HypA/HybF involved in hydrogenase expression
MWWCGHTIRFSVRLDFPLDVLSTKIVSFEHKGQMSKVSSNLSYFYPTVWQGSYCENAKKTLNSFQSQMKCRNVLALVKSTHCVTEAESFGNWTENRIAWPHKNTATYANINPGHGSEQAHIYGGDKLINRIPTLAFLIIGKT